ncbi:type II toxin-antitoxin system PemK/MazF family toxin [Longispora fulva]|uniref:mRNA-degrading endonuclease toxin of MazEF toxin-antitoxin module n=1 Tax=Longispora fulva TaxID=619741 RepID=A0A8J7G9H3_9ACTN|nr:type II toxin-antitoxin system PemK/MazF family toxin [Longispora fulva]MBG6136233.1 mRNA-degrading endonuclease toxin of MazEF toxin-antitoxin module [Longispora fulva]
MSDPSPLTGERELYVVASSDLYNEAGGPTVLVAEIEVGTRLRATPLKTAIETPWGVVLCDRLTWLPVEYAGEHFGQLAPDEITDLIEGSCRVIRGARPVG